MNLTELVRQAQAGDQEAMGQLYEQTSQRVYALALRLTNDPELAMDVVQETYLSALQHLDGLRNPEAFVSWMFQIAANRCHRLHKQQGRFVQVSKEEDEDGGFLEAIPDPDEGILPESVADNVETRRLVMGLVERLPEAQRECVILYYFSHCSVEQIAEIQGCAPGTVKSRLNYARKKLKEDVLALEERDGIRLYTLAPIGLLFPCLAGELPDPTVFSQTWQAVTAGLGTAGAAGATDAAAAGTQTAGGTTAAASAAGGKAAAGTAVKSAASGAFKLKLVAGLAAGGLLVGGVGLALHEPTLTFIDPVFEQNIRTIIDKPQGPIHPSDVEFIHFLHVTEEGISESWDPTADGPVVEDGVQPVNSLADVKNFPNIYRVVYSVDDNGALLDTFEASSQFQWLSFDDLGNSSPSVDHVDFLNQMPNLTYLDIEVAPGTDLTLLEQKESLVSLNLYTQGNMTLDISQLKHLEEIRVVSIDGTALLEVNNTLPSLRLLEFHDYDGDGVAFSPSLDTITNLPNLEYLSMDTAGADLTPLSTLSKLRAISLDGVSRPLDLTPLTQCPNLEAYKLYGRGPDEGLVIPPELKTENAAGQTAQDIQFEISSDIMDRSLT